VPALYWTDGVYLHFDLDVLDPSEAVANQWPTPGGMTVEEVCAAVRTIRERTTIKAAGFASYDPGADTDGRAGRAASKILEAVLGLDA
jgi:arginase